VLLTPANLRGQLRLSNNSVKGTGDVTGRSGFFVTAKAGEIRPERLRQSDNQMELIPSLAIGALVGLVIVAFILLTGPLVARMYPAGGSGWRRILVPALGSLGTGYLLYRYFPSHAAAESLKIKTPPPR
jgi:hypothetical protein